MSKVLLVRMDKIGDLVLSLPADQCAKLQGARVTWLVAKGCGFVPRHANPKREYIESAKNWSFFNFRHLVKTIKKLGPDIAIVLHAPWWVGLALWRAGVPRRFGRRSQWHSWLFFNSGLRQSRKGGERHESDLNFELVARALGDSTNGHNAYLKLMPPSAACEQWGLVAKDYFVVHPGMAGSALNVSPQRWCEIVDQLLRHSMVVVTGTKMDRPYTNPLFKKLGQETRIAWLNEKLNTDELLSVLGSARAIIAPSTGVLHLAASLGTPVLGIYSPVKVQRPTRWGPRGPKVLTLVPEAKNGEDPKTVMNRITPNQIIDGLRQLGALL